MHTLNDEEGAGRLFSREIILKNYLRIKRVLDLCRGEDAEIHILLQQGEDINQVGRYAVTMKRPETVFLDLAMGGVTQKRESKRRF